MTFESLLADREYGSVKNHNFKFKINNLKLSKLSQSKLRDVKVVGHGAITSVAIDRLGKKIKYFLQFSQMKIDVTHFFSKSLQPSSVKSFIIKIISLQ